MSLERLPIFPLPDVVLFPHALLPLHIFEPRYRALARDVLAGDRTLSIVRLKPGFERDYEGRPPIFPIGCSGVMTHVERLGDGRFNIVLRGVARVRICEELRSGEPYRLVRGETLTPSLPLSPRVATLADGLKRLVLALSAAQRGPEMQALVQIAARAKDPGDLADVVASAILHAPRERQAVLEAVEIVARLELVTQAAAAALAQTASNASAPN